MFTGKMIEFENGVEVGQGRVVRSPSTYTVETHDVDLDAKRSVSGYADRNRVRANAHSCIVTWERISWDELVALISAGNADEFRLTILDPKAVGGYYTGQFYRDANMSYELKNIYSEEEAYWTTSMAFVEF